MTFAGCSSRENFKNWLVCWRKTGLFRGSRYDEKIWPQKYCKASWSLYTEWASVYGDGIHALWRFKNISLSTVSSTKYCSNYHQSYLGTLTNQTVQKLESWYVSYIRLGNISTESNTVTTKKFSDIGFDTFISFSIRNINYA